MLAPHDCSHAGSATALLVAFLVAPLLPPPALHAQAQWTSNGLPVCVRPDCSGFYTKICGDGLGGAVIAWNRNPTLSDEDIYAKRVLHSGTIAPGWPTRGTLVTGAPGDQYLSDIAPDGQGGAFFVWSDWPNYDIYAQHVLGNGAIAAGWPANGLPVSVKPGYQVEP